MSIVKLITKRAVLETELGIAKQKLKHAQAEEQSLTHKLENVTAQINAQKKKELTVSDHAILRYIERVCELDIEAMKKTLKDAVLPYSNTYGDGKYPLPINAQAVVNDNVIVTVH